MYCEYNKIGVIEALLILHRFVILKIWHRDITDLRFIAKYSRIYKKISIPGVEVGYVLPTV